MPGAFSDTTRQRAQTLTELLQAGSDIPREDLILFLEHAEADMRKSMEEPKPAARTKPSTRSVTEIDFF